MNRSSYILSNNNSKCVVASIKVWIFKEVIYYELEIKPCGLGSRIRDMEAFWYKTDIKIIYFVQLCLIVWFTLTLNFLYWKLKKASSIFLRIEADWFFDPMLSRKAFAINSLK